MVLFIKGLKVISIHGTSKSNNLLSIRLITDVYFFFSVADYKYDDENDYGNGMYTPTFDDGSRNSHFGQDHGKPKPYLNFINSV